MSFSLAGSEQARAAAANCPSHNGAVDAVRRTLEFSTIRLSVYALTLRTGLKTEKVPVRHKSPGPRGPSGLGQRPEREPLLPLGGEVARDAGESEGVSPEGWPVRIRRDDHDRPWYALDVTVSALYRRHSDFRHDPAPARSPRADQAGPWLGPLIVALFVAWLAAFGVCALVYAIWTRIVG